MPPKESKLDAVDATAILPLQDWLKLLSSRGVDMRIAMTLAAKIYNSHNTKERLSQLDAKKLGTLISDKEAKKAVLSAVKGIASGQTPSKKRTRDSDLLQPLHQEEEVLPKSLDFNEITDPEELLPVTITTNRAPLKTAWAYTVALRMGFDPQEALSIAHVYVHLSSLKHALMLGNILNKEETRDAQEELSELPTDESDKKRWKGKERGKAEEVVAIGSSQPWVGIMRAKIPVIERQDGTWRAIQKGVPVQPSVAYMYITKAFKTYTPHIMGSLKLVAETYPPDELNRLGLHMYNAFKPDVIEWGQKATISCVTILEQLKAPISDEADIMAKDEAASAGKVEVTDETAVPDSNGIHLPDDGSELSDIPPDVNEVDPDEPPAKRQMTLEEYEAMLDAEDLESGFLEAGDIIANTATNR